MKKLAFTLAEILVSLGVIGVVAAMTIPTLMQNYQKDVYVTSLKKAYNDIDNAIQRKMTDMNADDLIQAGLTSATAVNQFTEQYLKYNRKCTGLNDCFATHYGRLKGGSVNLGARAGGQSYILASGASVRLSYDSNSSHPNRAMNIWVDTNGTKGPNIFGRDLFILFVYKNGLIDDCSAHADNAPLTEAKRESSFNQNCNTASDNAVWGCFGKILNDNWQMNY